MPDEVFDDFLAEYGEIWGNGKYDVYRPDYATVSAKAASVIRNKTMRCDKTTSSQLPEPNIMGAEYYSIFCPRIVDAGDIFIPIPQRAGVPRLTLQNVDERKEAVAFRTDRVGSIATQAESNTPLYTNVLFDFCGVDPPGPALDPNFQGSTDIATRRAIMFYRKNIQIGHYLTDILTGQWFQIIALNQIGLTLELFLKVIG